MMKNFRFNFFVILAGLFFLALTGKSEATTGELSHGQCVATHAEAKAIYFTHIDPWLFMDGQDNHELHVYTFEGGIWKLRMYFFAKVTGVVTTEETVILPDMIFPPCVLNDFVVMPNAVDIAYAFGWGFGIIMLFFFFGYVIAIALQAINLI